MKICRLEAGRPTDVREIPGAYGNISTGGRFVPEMAADGWRRYMPTGQPHIKTDHWVDTGTDAVQVVDSVYSQAELDQQAADQAARDAAAAAQAALLAAMPAQFPTGVAVPIPDAEGHWMILQPTGDGAAVIAVRVSDSPIDPETWAERKQAALARIANTKATLAADLDTKRTRAIANAAAMGNGVPAIRGVIADMQAQIDALRALLEVR